jgi:hypothetical protein
VAIVQFVLVWATTALMIKAVVDFYLKAVGGDTIALTVNLTQDGHLVIV